jgi:hypothetical protein
LLGSDWFDLIVDAAQGDTPGGRTPIEYAQAIADAGLGDGFLQVVEIEPRMPVRREGKPPRGHEYPLPLSQTAGPGNCLVDAYEARIWAELEEPEIIILELPGLALAIEVSNGDNALCDT